MDHLLEEGGATYDGAGSPYPLQSRCGEIEEIGDGALRVRRRRACTCLVWDCERPGQLVGPGSGCTEHGRVTGWGRTQGGSCACFVGLLGCWVVGLLLVCCSVFGCWGRGSEVPVARGACDGHRTPITVPCHGATYLDSAENCPSPPPPLPCRPFYCRAPAPVSIFSTVTSIHPAHTLHCVVPARHVKPRPVGPFDSSSAVAVFLASDKASFMHGVDITVDG